jgi:hypothetical protein
MKLAQTKSKEMRLIMETLIHHTYSKLAQLETQKTETTNNTAHNLSYPY